MADNVRLSKVLRELNISIDRAIDFLESKSIEIEKRPTAKISAEVYELLSGEFQNDASKKVASKELGAAKQKEKEALRIKRELEIEEKLKRDAKAKEIIKAKKAVEGPKTVGKIDLSPKKPVKKDAEPKGVPADKKAEVEKPATQTPASTPEVVADKKKVSESTSELTSAAVKTNYAKINRAKING